MDRYTPVGDQGEDYYNRSFSIIQSSCMGKSRMVDESARYRFTFPINIHEEMDPSSRAYPPFDDNVRNYLTILSTEDSEVSVLTRYYVFLEALFNGAVNVLKGYEKGSPVTIAKQWYDWMAEGSTVTKVGKNRTNFYDKVITKAKEFELKANTIKYRQECLISAANSFIACLEGLHTEVAAGFLAAVYFDEAHTLYKEQDCNLYFSLMDVLNTLVKHPIFFIFISTDSNLNIFVPTDERCSSIQVQKGLKLIPPFSELPFDCFCTNFTEEAEKAGKLTLYGVCELGQVVRFGRPVWSAYYQALKDKMKYCTREFARLKLGPSTERSQLAALDCRVILRYDPLHPDSQSIQADLVKWYMRVVRNIPEVCGKMRSGYPSEPMLAEAAACLLSEEAQTIARRPSNRGRPWNDESYQLINLFPAILEKIFNSGLLARGGLGELVVRTLFTVAHDLAIIKQNPTVSNMELQFHRPIKLLDLLESLCSPECWKTINSATPYEAFPGDPILKEAFKDAWVNFSHFVQLGYFDCFDFEYFSVLLQRGAAAQAISNGVIPLYFGDPAKTLISRHNTSVLLFQVPETNAEVLSEIEPINENHVNDLPIVSITFEFGKHSSSTLATVNTTVIDSDTPTGTTSSKETSSYSTGRRHYMITLYGCTSETYKCVPNDSWVYRALVGDLNSQETPN